MKRIVWLLGVLMILAMMYGAAFFSQKAERREMMPSRSIHNAQPTGYMGWYLAAQQAGLKLHVWRRPFSRLAEMPEGSAMIVVEPHTVSGTQLVFGENESERLLQWVAKGNTLVLLDNFGRVGPNTLLRQLGWRAQPLKSQTEFALNAGPNADPTLWKYVYAPIRTGLSTRLSQQEKMGLTSQILLQDDQGRPALIQVRYGRGTLVLGTIADLADNRDIQDRERDNFQFWTNLLAHLRQPLYLNEYVHGYQEAEDLFAYYQQRTPLGQVLLHLVLGMVAVFMISVRPWRPPSPKAVAEPAVGLAAFLQSMAALYQRRSASQMALVPLVREIERTLRRRYHVELVEASRIRALLEADENGYSGEALTLALQEAALAVRQGQRLSPSQVLKLVRQLTVIQERLHHGTHPRTGHTNHRVRGSQAAGTAASHRFRSGRGH